jgi:hypothetical protein
MLAGALRLAARNIGKSASPSPMSWPRTMSRSAMRPVPSQARRCPIRSSRSNVRSSTWSKTRWRSRSPGRQAQKHAPVKRTCQRSRQLCCVSSRPLNRSQSSPQSPITDHVLIKSLMGPKTGEKHEMA